MLSSCRLRLVLRTCCNTGYPPATVQYFMRNVSFDARLQRYTSVKGNNYNYLHSFDIRQCARHTPGLAFRSLSSKVCRNCIVTPLKRHSLTLHICPPTLSEPSKNVFTNKTVEATQRLSTHVNMKRIHTGKKNLFRLDLSAFDFIWAGLSNVDGYTRNAWYNLSCLRQNT